MTSLPLEGDVFDGKYLIGPVLGIGGMAAVLSARHLGLDERVALKVLLPECCDDPAVVERFVQEGKTAIKIRSEHVVRMLDVGVCEGRAYLVMEYLDGTDLEALLRKGGPLPVSAAVDLLLQACEAVGEAHALGIIHRDLKPANLFLTHRVDGSRSVKVLDFGISKMPRGVSGIRGAGSYPTLPSVVMGSPQYMSPEQMASAAAADQRSDIWSLGAILYELLTGKIAFDGGTTAEVCARVLQGAPAPLEQLRSDLPDAIVAVVGRCLAKDRAHRYANVSELADAVAPLGSAGARASAASIARVFEGGLEERSRSPSTGGTMKPTAAEIMARVPTKRGRRVSGYLVGALLSVAALGLVGAAVALRFDSFHLRWPVVAAARPSIAPPPAAPLPSPPPPASAAVSAAGQARRLPSHGHLDAGK